MLQVIITAAGSPYQRAAAAAAATFAVHCGADTRVSVLLPSGERASAHLRRQARQFGFATQKFPFIPGDPGYLTSWLKCQAFVWVLERLPSDDLALFADADTCCLKPVRLAAALKKRILCGHVGLAPDIVDRHFEDPKVPWYLTPQERRTYVNSGVIFAGRRSLPFFQFILKLSKDPRFLQGPFQDQKALNFAFGKHFPKTLVLVPRQFNAICSCAEDTVISHFAGGAGLLGKQSRSADHLKMCSRELADAATRRAAAAFVPPSQPAALRFSTSK